MFVYAMNPRLLIASAALLLAACDIPGLGPDPRIAMREAEGKAIGGACRYAIRGIEECYQLNPKALKTAVFEGWREMDQYMRENKIEGQATPSPDDKDKDVVVEDKKAPASAEKKPVPAVKPASAGQKAS